MHLSHYVQMPLYCLEHTRLCSSALHSAKVSLSHMHSSHGLNTCPTAVVGSASMLAANRDVDTCAVAAARRCDLHWGDQLIVAGLDPRADVAGAMSLPFGKCTATWLATIGHQLLVHAGQCTGRSCRRSSMTPAGPLTAPSTTVRQANNEARGCMR